MTSRAVGWRWGIVAGAATIALAGTTGCVESATYERMVMERDRAREDAVQRDARIRDLEQQLAGVEVQRRIDLERADAARQELRAEVDRQRTEVVVQERKTLACLDALKEPSPARADIPPVGWSPATYQKGSRPAGQSPEIIDPWNRPGPRPTPFAEPPAPIARPPRPIARPPLPFGS